ncbi:lytic transglycosylase domain-containing protein [Aureimonas fodinaquatilis]|uniref:Lytic transglycosylase domain-containing protein n=1 Tax=Aureimonas fodinaquatilis TaxID=2565783 RepID=A0A5B0E0H3_9HYPH|nr:lytic transglycosylase domain-containing protein [Aureimonas fodinaquatilis]KAA0972574.1 lytic transglycosylase domain-containing protein [Aureimonas fodinaquatilis]
MNRLPAILGSVMLLLAPIQFVQADTASTTSTAPLAEPESQKIFADEPFADLIAAEAERAGVSVELAHAVVFVESNYRPEVTGSAGEIGLMQIKLATARDMGFRGSRKALYDPATNLKYGLKYLAGAQERGGGTLCGTILKYNAGHFAKRSNPTSRKYCKKVNLQLAKY